jgi:hypothetical protein
VEEREVVEEDKEEAKKVEVDKNEVGRSDGGSGGRRR